MEGRRKGKVGTYARSLRRRVAGALCNEDGVGTVEVVLLILVAVGLVIIFKDQITTLVNSIFQKITSQAGKI